MRSSLDDDLLDCFLGINNNNSNINIDCSQRNIHCEPKKHTKILLSYRPQNPVDSDKNLADIVLNNFAIQQFKRFAPHVNIVDTLPCETQRGRFESEQQWELRTQKHTNCFCHIVYKTRLILIKFCTYCPYYLPQNIIMFPLRLNNTYTLSCET